MGWLEITLALVSAVFGGGLLKIADTMINKNKVKFDQNAAWRSEFRTDMDILRKEFKDLQVDFRAERKAREDAEDTTDRLRYEFERFKIQMYKVLTDNRIDTTLYDWDMP